ncbi:MAG TPA: radical SAM/Cys-rich domain protein [Nitrospirae bacterium]|nr:radical SAM/Cys-rich domain protein [Nitrospirota bacterium]
MNQASIETGSALAIAPFATTLAKNKISLTRDKTTTLQINIGFLCNQNCRHCHVEAGPKSDKIMDAQTADAVADFAEAGGFSTADITGGAPEMNPNLSHLIEKLAPSVSKIIVRSNLTAISNGKWDGLMEIFQEHKVTITASLPSLNKSQTDAQRGSGVYEKSLAVLKKLNGEGYGIEGTGLELNFVSNPAGAFLPPSQASLETRFRSDLKRKFGIKFNNLYTFANAPLGRFETWLKDSGAYGKYMDRLVREFNPCSVGGLMCRYLVSISWEGYLYDCDFNLACDLPLAGRKIHVSEMTGPPAPGSPIVVGDHCYTCCAGAGFT